MTDDLDTLNARLAAEQKKLNSAPGAAQDGGRRGMGDALQLAMDLVIATALGLFIGIMIDRNFGTKPWFMLIFLILGVAAGFRNFYLFGRKLLRPDEEKTD